MHFFLGRIEGYKMGVNKWKVVFWLIKICDKPNKAVTLNYLYHFVIQVVSKLICWPLSMLFTAFKNKFRSFLSNSA